MKKLIVLLIIIAVGIAGYFYVFKNHRNIKEEEGLVIETKTLIESFEKNEESANKLYLDKTIQIKGTVSGFDEASKSIILDDKIFCIFDKAEKAENGKPITIKGRLLGYDSLLGEIKLDQCSIIK